MLQQLDWFRAPSLLKRWGFLFAAHYDKGAFMRRILGFSLLLLVFASPAYAMHISEGILPLNWAAFWYVVAIPFIFLGLRKLKEAAKDDLSFKPLVGLITAVVFVISCMPIPVPTAGTCSHPCGTAISAILLTPFISVVVAAVALLIQALFLSHGNNHPWREYHVNGHNGLIYRISCFQTIAFDEHQSSHVRVFCRASR